MAAEIKKIMSVKKHESERHDFDPTMFYENRVKEDEAYVQNNSIIEALKEAALEWTFESIHFVSVRCGAVVEDAVVN